MNYARICTEILCHPDLSDGAKVLFGVIHSYKINTCFATNDYLAKHLICSPSKIKRNLKELIAHGYVMSVLKYAPDMKTIKSRRLRVASHVTVQNKRQDADGVGNQFPAQVVAKKENAFVMSMDWQPSESFCDYLKQSGIDHERIHDSTRNELLGEFKSFWLTRSDREHTENQWLHKLRANFIRSKSTLYDAPKAKSLRDTGVLKSLTDTSWAHKTPMEILNG